MKAKHHFWSSLVAGGALYAATGSAGALAGAMVGGFLIDADHVLDQMWSIRSGSPYATKPASNHPPPVGGPRALFYRYFRRRKLVRLPLIFHSYELFAVLVAVTVTTRAPFMIGLVAGYALHIALDLIKHYHEFRSPFFYLLAYRLAHRFIRDRLIKAEYL
jgi:hypothetical protein